LQAVVRLKWWHDAGIFKMSFEFNFGPRLVCGAGSSANIADHVSGQRILLITDAAVHGLGLCQPALQSLRGRTVAIFDAVEPDPSVATVESACAMARDFRPDAIVGIGGGSPMDVAKVVAYLIGSGDRLDDIYGINNARKKALPLVLVPTTAGTGSEATPISIITVGETEKKGIVAPALYAEVAVLDAALTLGLPMAVTAASGIDAMVHAIEAFTSKHLRNPISDSFAMQALQLLSANIREACTNGQNLAVRDSMLRGAYLAGLAFANAPVGGVHALAYPLGGHFHVSHGVSNALMLAPVIAYNMPEAASLYAALAPSIGAAPNADAFLCALQSIIADCKVVTRLRDVGVTEDKIELLASEAMKQQRLLINNPRIIDQAAAQMLYAGIL
jgi:alcohol dehydrogenase class IV